MSGNGFARYEADGIVWYSCIALGNLPGIRHGFSTRSGGTSAAPEGSLNLGYVPWDTRANVRENRRRFLSGIGVKPDSLATIAQIHSTELHIVRSRADQWDSSIRGDALATTERGVTLAVQVADCFPILFADPHARAVAAVHAGWRGMLARILGRTLEGMRNQLNTNAAEMLVALGPGIRSCCFEVGLEIASAFQIEFPGMEVCSPRAGAECKFLVDLPRAAAIQLLEAGVPLENIFDSCLCTRCRPLEFFSHRAEGVRAGRMMGIICSSE